MHSPHPLLRPLDVLEHEYSQCIRNFTPELQTIIESHPILPAQFTGEAHMNMRYTHALYAQIRARKEGVTPDVSPEEKEHIPQTKGDTA